MLKSVRLKNYRNLKGLFNLEPSANVICAPNGSGKSNLIEAIYQASALKIFRPHTDISQVIKENEQFAEIVVELDNLFLKVVVSKNANEHVRKLWINDKPTQPKNFRGNLYTVLFAPHSVDLVSNDPSNRRSDLDDYISQLDLNYADLISKFEKIIKHRNALLKHIQNFSEAESQLSVWDTDLVATATQIINKRLKTLNSLYKQSENISKQLFPGRAFSMHYLDSASGCEWDVASALENFDQKIYAQRFSEELEANRKKDIITGTTSVGPHRDDWDLRLDNDSLRYLGSRGQQRLGVFVYKLSQIDLLKQDKQEVILLLDDIFSELDMQRREFVADLLLKEKYFFLLSAVGEAELPDNLKSANRINLK